VKKTSLTIIACSTMLLGIFAVAARSGAAPTPVPHSVPNFAPMNMFLGTWTCHQMLRGRDRPDTSTTTMALDGQYMMTHDVAPPFDRYRTQTVVTDSYLTYNPLNHMWVTVSIDNFGGYSVSATPGWHGDTMTTTTRLTNDGSKGSDVLTRISSTRTRDTSVSTDAHGHVTRATTTCTKTS
jgi:hypothetical protein